jgi:formylglycine-generating enzyme required for sulfatase activity
MPEQPFDSLAADRLIDHICDQFEAAWSGEHVPNIESLLQGVPDAYRTRLIEELIGLDIELRRSHDLPLSAEDYQTRFPDVSLVKIQSLLKKTDEFDQKQKTLGASTFDIAKKEEKSTTAKPTMFKKVHYFGDYELLERVARGGMGTVYRARQISLNRIVAVKMINSGQFATREQIQRFYSEAESAASLDHPHIVPVYEVGEYNGEHFFSMAFNEGVSLEARLTEGPMQPMQAAELMQLVANAIQFAHDRGVIHRDIKPSNILLDPSTRPRVSDFGLAKRIADASSLTASGTVLGTPSFMPPEQAAGKMDAIGFASDVYSLGAVLYACLAGRPPFQAANHLETLKQVVDCEPVPLRQWNPSIPRDLETITHKCLDKSMARRYGSPCEMADDLQRFRNGLPIVARPVSTFERSLRWCRRHPSSALNAAAALLIVLGTTIGWFVYQAHDRELRAQAKAAALVDQLNLASADGLPFAVQQARANPLSLAMLRIQFRDEPLGTNGKYRAALALLSTDQSVIDELCYALPDLSWKEWIFVTEELAPSSMIVDQRLSVNDLAFESTSDYRFLRIIATEAWIMNAIAVFDPARHRPSKFQVQAHAQRIIDAALLELYRDPSQMIAASEALRPLRKELGRMLAKRIEFTQPNGALDSSLVASLLTRMFRDEPDELLELCWFAHGDALPVLLAGLKDSNELRETLRSLAQVRGLDPNADWDTLNLARRKSAVAGLALAILGEWESVWPMLDHTPDSSRRSMLIEWIPRTIQDPSTVINRAMSLLTARSEHVKALEGKQGGQPTVPSPWLFDSASSQLRACFHILGNYSMGSLKGRAGDAFWDMVKQRSEIDPDPGLHAISQWLLRMHQRQLLADSDSQRVNPSNEQQTWRHTKNGHCMVALAGPIHFVAGANLNDPDRDAGNTIDPVDQTKEEWSLDHPHSKRIPRSFEIATFETNFQQLQKFDSDFHTTQNKTLGPTLQHPACRVNWYQAAAYCNWLSEKENISKDQWCFVPNSNGKYEKGMSLAKDYLHRCGYRLPTEAEWEYACRAGTVTRRYFGETDELLTRYVWYIDNSYEKVLQIPGAQPPNELGLSDMLGNLQEWCLDSFYESSLETRFREIDKESIDLIVGSSPMSYRIVRGSSIWNYRWDIRASEFATFSASYSNGNTGFRIARTLKNFGED